MTTSIAPPRAHGTGTTTTIKLPQQLTSRPFWMERIALRVALFLLTWSTRPHPDPVRARLENQQYLEREQREHAWAMRAQMERNLF